MGSLCRAAGGCKQMLVVFAKAGLFVTIHIVVIGGMLLLMG
jgi:hypothetical protein